MIRKKAMFAVFLILAIFVIITPKLLSAGGLFQQKIEEKLKAPRNIQYNAPQGMESQQILNYEGNKIGAVKDRLADTRREDSVSQRAAFQEPAVFSSYAIYRTDYKAEIEEDVVTVKGNVLFEVFRKGWTQIPLVKSSVGLIDVSINRGASFVIMQGGKYFLVIDKPGRYNLEIEFLIKASRERENGPGNFSFEVIPAPISQFEYMMPETGVEIFVEPAIKLELKREAKQTVAWAVMPNTDTINVRWSKALPKETITPVKLEPKVYLDTATYASIGEGLIRCNATLNYSVLQSEISSLRIALPEDVSVLDVKGKDLRDWKVSQDKGVEYLDVYLTFGVRGNYALNLSFERKIGEGSVVAQIPWVKGTGVEREKGFFGLAASTNVELAVNKTENVTLIDVKELPPSIWSSTTSPILLAFKYLKHPFSIEIDVTKHEELPVLVAAIDSASYTTLQTDDGKSLTKAVYQVRNNVKQFLHLVLPKDATLWSAFVASKPVKPAKDKNGAILIPLEKSQMQGESLTQFPVEIVYLDQTPRMRLVGNISLDLPKTDINISALNWLVYLPVEFAYVHFGGNVKPVKQAFYPRIPLMAVQGRVSQSVDDIGEQFSPQMAYKEVESLMVKGALPIKIDIPQEGKVYRFAKLIVTEKESPRLSISFVTVLKQTHGLLRFLILIAVIVFIFFGIKKIFRRKLPETTS